MMMCTGPANCWTLVNLSQSKGKEHLENLPQQ
jgi:hypothetical protein